MLHVFIDTNVLLRFYSYADDTLAEVEKLSALVKTKQIRLYVTEQVVDERARNRDKELAESIKRIEQLGASVQMPRFAEHHPAAMAFSNFMKEAKSAKTELLAAIRAEMEGEGLRADRVIQALFDASDILQRTPEIIRRAMLRRQLGNPPGKRETLGDQINWEILLEHSPEGADLHIVSRDGDFRGGVIDGVANFFLRGEWNYKKKARLHLYSGLGEFTKVHFPEIKVPADALKGAAIKALTSSGSYQQTHAAVADLHPILKSLTKEEAIALCVALTNNSQIRDILGDDDVKDFYKDLYLEFWIEMPPDLDKELMEISDDIFGVPF